MNPNQTLLNQKLQNTNQPVDNTSSELELNTNDSNNQEGILNDIGDVNVMRTSIWRWFSTALTNFNPEKT